LSILKESGVDFQFCDLLEAKTETIEILLALAQYEHNIQSEKIKKSLQEAKDSGTELGNPENLTDDARQRSIEARRANADNSPENKMAFAVIEMLRRNKVSYKNIAETLNDQGYQTRSAKKFYATTVKNIFNRFCSTELMKEVKNK
jgi:DNA invertase Pin-like site-specific DNA recombinase